MQISIQEIIEQTRHLAAQEAKHKRRLRLSPETLARLERLHTQDKVQKTFEHTQEHEKTDTCNLERTEQLRFMENEVRSCTRCALASTRTQVVFGTGSSEADLVFVGEAPGAEEDKQGEPFVGAAGQMLTRIIEDGMKIQRSDVYICNVLKCRPPGNRDPKQDEAAACAPYLDAQLDIISPKVICALGKHAAHRLLKTDESTSRLRGRWHEYRGIPVRVTYHPAYLVRQTDPEKLRAEKKKVWEDIKAVMRVLYGKEHPIPGR